MISGQGKGGGKRMFWEEKNKKVISGGWGVGGSSIRHLRISTKFKMIILNFWFKLTQKGYFQIEKMKITIEFYILKLI